MATLHRDPDEAARRSGRGGRGGRGGDAETADAALAAAGDGRAFERLYRAHVARIHSLVRRMMGPDQADDVTQDGDSFEVTTSPEALSSVREALEQAGIEVESAETTMVPKTTIELDQEAAARKTLRLIDALEELDDVNEVYANFDIPEQLLEAVAS